MDRRHVLLAITLLLLAATAWLCLNMVQHASAGIGPDGFAFYAKRGINHEINVVYGNGNSPYTVACQDHPNYQTISDNVTCQIRIKP